MTKKNISIIGIISIILICSTGIINYVIEFFSELVLLSVSEPSISFISSIFKNKIVFLISYGFVGIIFKTTKIFDGKLMSIAYFVISTILSFVICSLIYFIENNYLILTILVIISLIIFIIKLLSTWEIE